MNRKLIDQWQKDRDEVIELLSVAAELAGIPTSTFHRNYPYWEGYIYDSDGRIIGEKCSKTNKRK